jgi:hypothetical protein
MNKPTVEIKYSTADKDWSVKVNGEVIGYDRTRIEAEARLNKYVTDLAALAARCITKVAA